MSTLTSFQKFVYAQIISIAKDTDEETARNIKAFAKEIVTTPKLFQLFHSAFTTQKYAIKHNEEGDLESLEFIGDQTLRVPIAKYVTKILSKLDLRSSPGLYTKAKNYFEAGTALFRFASGIGVTEYIRKLSEEEERKYDYQTVEDVFEAFMGAMFCTIEKVAGNIGDAYTVTHTYFTKLLETSKAWVTVDEYFKIRADSWQELKDHMGKIGVVMPDGRVQKVIAAAKKPKDKQAGGGKDWRSKGKNSGSILTRGDEFIHYIDFNKLHGPNWDPQDRDNEKVRFQIVTKIDQDFDRGKWAFCLAALNYLNYDEVNKRARSPKEQLLLLLNSTVISFDSGILSKDRFAMPVKPIKNGTVLYDEIFDSEGRPRKVETGNNQAIYRGGGRGRGRGDFSRGRGGRGGTFGDMGRGGTFGDMGRGGSRTRGTDYQRGRGGSSTRGSTLTFAKK